MFKIYKYFICILIIFILNFNISFAKTELTKEERVQLKADMNKEILAILSNSEQIDNVYNDGVELYSKCLLLKNNLNELKKCSEQMTQNVYKLSYIDIYKPLLEVAKKYDIEISNEENEYDFINKKILKKYKIDNIKEFRYFVKDIKNKKIKLLKMRDDITSHIIVENDDSLYMDNSHIPAAAMEQQKNIEDDFWLTFIQCILFSSFIFLILACTYFLPSTVAILKGHKNTLAVVVLNIFLGWTFLGWVIALVWACCKNK